MVEDHGSFSKFWKLNHATYCGFVIADSAGKVLDLVKDRIDLPFAIIKASINDQDVAAALTACLCGGTTEFNVSIVEMTWIKKLEP